MKVIWNDDNMKKLGFEIRKELKRQKLTIRKLSNLSGLHKNSVNNVLKGQRATTYRTIMKILLALEIDFNELFKKVYLD
jgi:transcriptional regulator with XRE-family HTH domain